MSVSDLRPVNAVLEQANARVSTIKTMKLLFHIS
jgi:hypothetical protein